MTLRRRRRKRSFGWEDGRSKNERFAQGRRAADAKPPRDLGCSAATAAAQAGEVGIDSSPKVKLIRECTTMWLVEKTGTDSHYDSGTYRCSTTGTTLFFITMDK